MRDSMPVYDVTRRWRLNLKLGTCIRIRYARIMVTVFQLGRTINGRWNGCQPPRRRPPSRPRAGHAGAHENR